MKAVALACGLLLLGGCGVGTFYNLADGPQVYGGVRQDLWWYDHSGKAGFMAGLDVPGSAILDTALLPLTALFELLRWLTGWPPPGAPG